jgi:hypothetical protein
MSDSFYESVLIFLSSRTKQLALGPLYLRNTQFVTQTSEGALFYVSNFVFV